MWEWMYQEMIVCFESEMKQNVGKYPKWSKKIVKKSQKSSKPSTIKITPSHLPPHSPSRLTNLPFHITTAELQSWMSSQFSIISIHDHLQAKVKIIHPNTPPPTPKPITPQHHPVIPSPILPNPIHIYQCRY